MLFSFCLQSFSASESFPMSRLFTLADQCNWASASASVLPMNSQVGFLQNGLVGSPCSPGDSQESSATPWFKASVLQCSTFFMVQLTSIYDYWKNQSFDYLDLFGNVRSLLLNTLSIFVIACLPRTKHLLIFWLRSISAMVLEPRKIKSITASTFSSSVCNEVMGLDVTIFVFWILSFKPAFYSLLSPSSRGSLVPLHFLSLEWYICISEVVDISDRNLCSNLWFVQPSISHDVLCV